MSPLQSQIRVLSPRALVDENVVPSLLPLSRRETRMGSSFAVSLGSVPTRYSRKMVRGGNIVP